MSNLTTLDRIADAASRFFMPELLATEDFDSFEASVSERSRKIGALCLKSCLESFDKMLREHLPGGWTLHDVRQRTLITLLGPSPTGGASTSTRSAIGAPGWTRYWGYPSARGCRRARSCGWRAMPRRPPIARPPWNSASSPGWRSAMCAS